MFYLSGIEYDHQNLILDQKTNLSAIGVEFGERGSH